MKINGYQQASVSTNATADAAKAKGAQPKAQGPHGVGVFSSTGEGKVVLSHTARELQAQSEASAAKVEKLKGAIQNGSFKVDAHAIAGKMLADHDGDE